MDDEPTQKYYELENDVSSECSDNFPPLSVLLNSKSGDDGDFKF